MKHYRDINDFLEGNNQSRTDVINDIADAALTLLLFVEDHGILETRDINTLSQPLFTLHKIITEVNGDISKVQPETE